MLTTLARTSQEVFNGSEEDGHCIGDHGNKLEYASVSFESVASPPKDPLIS